MILSPGRKFVFIHIPKTGGTSLALALEARAMKDDMMLGDTPKALKRRRKLAGRRTHGRLWKHSTLADIEGLLPDRELDQMFAFTLVRNPWDRAVSYYHWLKAQQFDHPAVALAQRLTFCDFICAEETQASFRANPASRYMRRSDGRVQCHAFLRLEHFASDAAPLFDHLGFHFELPHSNQSRRDRDWRSYYDAQSHDAICNSCAEDISQFEYFFNH